MRLPSEPDGIHDRSAGEALREMRPAAMTRDAVIFAIGGLVGGSVGFCMAMVFVMVVG